MSLSSERKKKNGQHGNKTLKRKFLEAGVSEGREKANEMYEAKERIFYFFTVIAGHFTLKSEKNQTKPK